MIGKNQILINQMLNGDVDAIKIGLNSDNTALKINAIIHSTVFCVDDDIVISKIKKDREFLKKRYAGKTVAELNVEFEKLKKEFLDAHKELQQKSNSQLKFEFYKKQVDFW